VRQRNAFLGGAGVPRDGDSVIAVGSTQQCTPGLRRKPRLAVERRRVHESLPRLGHVIHAVVFGVLRDVSVSQRLFESRLDHVDVSVAERLGDLGYGGVWNRLMSTSLGGEPCQRLHERRTPTAGGVGPCVDLTASGTGSCTAVGFSSVAPALHRHPA